MLTTQYSEEVLKAIHECGLSLMTPTQTSLITQGGEALLHIINCEKDHEAYIRYWSGVFKTQMAAQRTAIEQATKGSTPALKQVVKMLQAIRIQQMK